LSELVSVTPVEYQEKRIIRYFGYKLDVFDAERLTSVVKKFNIKQSPRIWEDSGMIFYQYPEKPLIVIKERRFYTTREVWEGESFTQKQIRQQASILLRMLGKSELALCRRKSIAKWKFIPRKLRKRSSHQNF